MRPDRILLYLSLLVLPLFMASASADTTPSGYHGSEVVASATHDAVTGDIQATPADTFAVAIPLGLAPDDGAVAMTLLGRFDANAPDDVEHALILTLLGANDAHRYLLESDAPLTLHERGSGQADAFALDYVKAPGRTVGNRTLTASRRE